MGYMGFGMNKDVYTRKPRKPSKKLRELFASELRGKLNNNVIGGKNFTKEEIEKAKAKIRKDFRNTKIKNGVLFLITIIILFILFWQLIN